MLEIALDSLMKNKFLNKKFIMTSLKTSILKNLKTMKSNFCKKSGNMMEYSFKQLQFQMNIDNQLENLKYLKTWM